MMSCVMGQKNSGGMVAAGAACDTHSSPLICTSGERIRTCISRSSCTVLTALRTCRSLLESATSVWSAKGLPGLNRISTLRSSSSTRATGSPAWKAASTALFASNMYGHHISSSNRISSPLTSGVPRHHCQTTTDLQGTSAAQGAMSSPVQVLSSPGSTLRASPGSMSSSLASSTNVYSASTSLPTIRHSPCTRRPKRVNVLQPSG
mmetsp:Transcript_19409/g.63265  ORF Transcript_19409/g.63265 Transcript_19409/m.63265 type:complete len:206 (-) Transcript_19409:281-898(-)